MTKLEKVVRRTVTDEHGQPVIVSLTPQGITFRRPRTRDTYTLPYAAGEWRAITIKHGGVGQATGRVHVSRGLLTTSR